MRGRPPKPIALRRLDGDTRKRGAQKHEQIVAKSKEASRGRPEMPAALQARKKDPADVRSRLTVARAHWRYLADCLFREGLLSDMDEGMLTSAAIDYSLMIDAFRAGERRDFAHLMQRYMQAADRMGLNESARAKFADLDRVPVQPAARSIELEMCG